jgi:hypothetical protein
MAIGFTDPRSGYNDAYDGMRYYEQQERRYREEMDRQRMMAMQETYCINTDTYRGMTAQQMAEAKPAKKVVKAEPDYLTNQKLLLLGEAT